MSVFENCRFGDRSSGERSHRPTELCRADDWSYPPGGGVKAVPVTGGPHDSIDGPGGRLLPQSEDTPAVRVAAQTELRSPVNLATTVQ